jgi:transposase
VTPREKRIAMLEMHKHGATIRGIAKALDASRNTVREVIASGDPERPAMQRASQLAEHVERVRELHVACKGNLVRVHEELERAGVVVAYATLTEFCREQMIGVVEKVPAGKYHFDPGVEMQHDTSPHSVTIGGVERLIQMASVVLPHSRMIFAQAYPAFTRFHCKTFLTEAIRFLGGATTRCMVDNSHVVVAYGTGPNAVMAPEMVAFGDRFGMKFRTRVPGDPNRNAHVERQFWTLETNFEVGRAFSDLADFNAQLVAWCEKKNAKYRTDLHAAPTTLFAAELPYLKPLPRWIPEVVNVEERRVDVERYVRLHTNSYSAPAALIGQNVEVHETIRHVRLFHRHKLVAEHVAFEPGANKKSTLPEHRRHRGASRAPAPMSPEEATLVAAGPEFAAMIALLRTKYHGQAQRAVRRLYTLFLDYPTPVLRAVLVDAVAHRAHDLGQIDRLVLQRVGADVFRVSIPKDDP